ncbi:recombination protein NinB [Limnoglobus roseus]|uniref:NinB protein n=1 Tax=Limnoglobus roseus TaxID=2598579 RepID=A0A5C1AL12_9BACT|nr:recombination protein NinB [Limnoglobus roseus]QEL19315.1 hypothetical protein PX52LOC_06380 [Limnoglobus roseus]
MTKGIEFTGRVENGRLPQHVSEKVAATIRKHEGKHLILTVAERKRTRSGQQNRYYWGCVVAGVTEMFRDAGNMVDADDVHEFLKQHVGKLSQVVVTPDGEVMHTIGSSAKLTTMEFSDYVERIRAWAIQYGLDIPSPDEHYQLNANQEGTPV